MSTILCLDDDAAIVVALERVLRHLGHEPLGARTTTEALQHLARGGVELVLSDYQMPGLTGLDFLELLRSEGHDVPLIMMTGYSSIEHAVVAMRAGAIDYLPKPIRPEQLEIALGRALEVVRVRRENEALRREVSALRNERQILGESAAIRRLLQTVAMAAPTRATVLL
ncbi:MAG TPA: response regulator, partial [Gemmatimonadaceae bacterium]|nr:response regulator [Gemmatimonadaceae bacterium]